jgi:peptidyl-prolyl cis-trans isomerase A (cyclophilin A)/peptidyl-prolyl cis-trans isomerase B (cyclophilin B)
VLHQIDKTPIMNGGSETRDVSRADPEVGPPSPGPDVTRKEASSMRRVMNPASLLVVVCLGFLAGCGGKDGPPPAASISSGSATGESQAGAASPFPLREPVQIHAGEPSTETPAWARGEDATVTISTNLGDITVRLHADKAPRTVDNFLRTYVNRGFYDGTVIHYVDRDFIIAAGGFSKELNARQVGDAIPNEANNGLKNRRGAVAMSRDPDYPDSADCQFFINLADNPSLDYGGAGEGDNPGYCVFGEVVAGMDVVDKIAALPVVDKDQFPKTPVEPVVIHSLRRTP